MRPIRRGLAAIVLHSEITAPGAIYWGFHKASEVLNCDAGAIYRVPSLPKCGFTADVFGYKGAHPGINEPRSSRCERYLS